MAQQQWKEEEEEGEEEGELNCHKKGEKTREGKEELPRAPHRWDGQRRSRFVATPPPFLCEGGGIKRR
jgi:hypothetical protein